MLTGAFLGEHSVTKPFISPKGIFGVVFILAIKHYKKLYFWRWIKMCVTKFNFVKKNSNPLEKHKFSKSGQICSCGVALCWATHCHLLQKTIFKWCLSFYYKFTSSKSRLALWSKVEFNLICLSQYIYIFFFSSFICHLD